MKSRSGAVVTAILTILFTLSLSACATAPTKSATEKQNPASALTSTPTPTLTPCPVVADWPVKPVTADVLAVVTKYYAEKNLTPITIYKNQESVLDVKEQSAGEHSCENPGGGVGGYVGAVPLAASAAVMVYVQHKPYPATQTPSNFVTLALMPGSGWTVVAEGTGP